MEKHLGCGAKVYDPYVPKDILPNQMHEFDSFLSSVDIVVIMVNHDEIKQNLEKLQGKVVLDTRHIILSPSNDVYYL
jgi:UDP-N-acetyl-D-mannosaminuronic acid dehydrogenase